MPSDFGHLSVNELKKELSRRGAKTTGRKAELVARLEAYDRNDNFRSNDVQRPAEVPMPAWPEASQFRSITENHRHLLPSLKQSHINQYVLYRQCQDKEENQVGENSYSASCSKS